jgi:hypothetical protein
VPLYNAIRDGTNKFQLSAFDDAVRMKPGGVSVASQAVEWFICPGFEHTPYVVAADSDYVADKIGGLTPAITNYFALSSTHLVKGDGDWSFDSKPDEVLQGNGALPMIGPKGVAMGWQKVKGATHAGISRDGTSYTFMFCEGRERGYAAWIDGQSTWTVAAWPASPLEPKLLDDSKTPGHQILGWPTEAADANGICIAKQAFGVADDQAGVYLPADHWSGSKNRKFGPSPNHPDGTVHGFADAHSKFMHGDIDRNVYLHLTTRRGAEAIPVEEFGE